MESPIINDDSRRFNLTNEGGAFGTVRLLKNVMGLWIIQKCRDIWQHETGVPLSYEELSDEAEEQSVDYTIDVDSPDLFNPPDMVKAIRKLCREQGFAAPENRGQIVSLVYKSLAEKYTQVIKEIEYTTKRSIDSLYIVGGGSQDTTLNKVVSSTFKGVKVFSGPSEATAIGNIMIQAYANGVVEGIHEIREVVRNSFDIRQF